MTEPLRFLAAVVGAVALLSGCAGVPHGGQVGSNPRGLSPQLVYEPPEFKQLVWWNPGSFESVPENMLAAGRAYCSCQDTDGTKYEPIGYHPYARGPDGKPLKGGGYLCTAGAASN